MAEAVALARLQDRQRVDWALGHAATLARFADGDFVCDRLPEESQARIALEEVEQLLGFHMNWLHEQGLQPDDVVEAHLAYFEAIGAVGPPSWSRRRPLGTTPHGYLATCQHDNEHSERPDGCCLREVWTSLDGLLADLSDEQWSAPSPLPGWSVQDNVSHIIGTEAMLSDQPSPAEIYREANPHVKNDIGASDEARVESLRSLSPSEVLARFREVTEARLAALDQMSDDEWNVESCTPAGKDTCCRFMQVRVFDYWLHEQDIRDAVSRPGHETGVAADVTLDEMENALGFCRKEGWRADCSESHVCSDRWWFHRARNQRRGRGTGRSGGRTVGAPTVKLTMPIGVMTRRCAGRVDRDDLLDEVSIDGNLDLASRILESQSYTI